MEYELYHYGVKGMKWGVRKKRERYVTVRQAGKNAKAAGEEAARKSYASNTNSGIGSYRRASNAASKAAKQARAESLAADKAYNKQLRAEKKAVNKADKEAKERDFRKSLNKKYDNDYEYYADLTTFGKNGVARISRSLDAGVSYTSAYSKEMGRRVALGLLAGSLASVSSAVLLSEYS